MTQTLLALNARYQANAADRDQLLRELLDAATARRQLLAALIETDPGAVLRVAVPTSVRATLPPAVQSYVEQEVELEGVLEVLVEDRDPGSRYLYFLQTPNARLSLHFAGEPPALVTGARVRVKGVRIDGALAVPA